VVLIVHLSGIVERRFSELKCEKVNSDNRRQDKLKNYSLKVPFKFILRTLWNNLSFIFLCFVSLELINDLYCSYGIYSIIICPIKTWSLFIAFYLKYKSTRLNIQRFEYYIGIQRINQISFTQIKESNK
jgi:hypothetical protein